MSGTKIDTDGYRSLMLQKKIGIIASNCLICWMWK